MRSFAVEVARPDLFLATMWAISDFTMDNGGTQLVPGSHRWDADRRAEMPAGSVLFWLGGTLHGAGANVTEADWRYGVVARLTSRRRRMNAHPGGRQRGAPRLRR